jgi:hypothetical protein
MVVAFGQGRKVLLPKPTADVSEILEAIHSVEQDETGIETTFTTVAEIVNRWGRYKDAQDQVYRTMVIVVTDEVGDDDERLEDAVASAQRAKVPVYVLGSQAVMPSPGWPPRLAGFISSLGSTPGAWGSTRPGCGNTSPTGSVATSTILRSHAPPCAEPCSTPP